MLFTLVRVNTEHPSRDAVLLRNARIVLPERIADRGSLIIENDRIERILVSPTETELNADNVIDLAGLTLFPGFIDIHIHGAIGVDTMEASANDLLRVAEFLARKGVTGWLPTLVPAPVEQYARTVSAISNSAGNQRKALSADGARVLGVHYEGPFVNSEQCGALHREHFRIFRSEADIDELPTIDSPGARHMMTLAPEVDGGVELIKELKKRNWIVSIGHTRATVEILDQAFAAGARHMTHFMNAMTPLHHRTLGAVGWGLLNDEVTCDVIADGIHIDPSILKLLIRNKTAETLSLISDAIAAAGQGDGDYQIWGETIVVKDGRTRNDRGSIAGSVITMLDAVRMMLSLGVSESNVARMASLNPGRLLGIDDDCGSIEAGKRADLVALDEKLNVKLTIIGGKIAYSES